MNKNKDKNKNKNNKIDPKKKFLDEANKIENLENEELKKKMRKELRELNKNIEEEEKYLNMNNLEKERINNLWITSKKDCDDIKTELINKEREKKDIQENHLMTINLYNQKVKHLKFQNQDVHTEKRIDIEKAMKELEDHNRIEQNELKEDNRNLKKHQKELRIANDNFKFVNDFEGEKKSIALRQEFEREARELKALYDLKMRKITEEMEEVRNNKIKQLESEKEEKIKEITMLHSQEYKNIKNYYNDITASILSCIKQLKGDIEKAQITEDKDKKKLQKIHEQNLQLSNPLKETLSIIEKLKNETKDSTKLEKNKDELRNKINKLDIEIREMEFQYEVKLQQFQYLEKEKNILNDKFEETMFDINQKSGLRNLILEKKLNLAIDALEIKNCEIKKILISSNIEESKKLQIEENLNEILINKDGLISQLKEDLNQIRRAHINMVKAYDGKLSECVIPVEELGFNPLVPTEIDN